MRIEWTPEAIDDLERIRQRAEEYSRGSGRRLIARFRSRTKQLLLFPRSGRIVPEYETDGFRELIERPYRILYIVEPDRVLITTVVHGAMDLRPDESADDEDLDGAEA